MSRWTYLAPTLFAFLQSWEICFWLIQLYEGLGLCMYHTDINIILFVTLMSAKLNKTLFNHYFSNEMLLLVLFNMLNAVSISFVEVLILIDDTWHKLNLMTKI